MKPIEKKIVEALQSGMPISERPFLNISQELNMTEKELIQQIESMKSTGLIRRLGLVPNHYAIGYTSNLMTVWDIDDSDIDQVGKTVGALDFVSHCYQRPRHLPDWPYNFFAMVHGKSEEEANNKMKQISRLIKDSCRQYTSLKSTKILKKTGLRI